MNDFVHGLKKQMLTVSCVKEILLFIHFIKPGGPSGMFLCSTLTGGVIFIVTLLPPYAAFGTTGSFLAKRVSRNHSNLGNHITELSTSLDYEAVRLRENMWSVDND